MTRWRLNGEPAERIDIGSRGLQYGDGLFETIAIRDGKPRLLSLHQERLAGACAQLGFPVPDLEDSARFAAESDLKYGVLKVIVCARAGKRGYGRESSAVDVLESLGASDPLPASVYLDGVEVTHCRTRLAVGSPVAGLKTLNRIEQVLAKNEIQEAGVFEGLTRDAEGRLICGTMSNLFVVMDKQIMTPALDRCGVRGVMRRHILNLLASTGRDVKVVEDLKIEQTDEVFLSNSQFGLLPVVRCNELGWPVGDVSKSVMELLAANGVREVAE